MLSVASSSSSSLPSMRDSYSKNISDSEQSKDTSAESQKPPESKNQEASTPSQIDASNGALVSEQSQTSTSVPFVNEDLQQKTDVDGSPSTSWQENLAGTGPPTTTVDTTTITTTSVSPISSSSLNIEQFDCDDQVSTPVASDIPDGPFSNSFNDNTQPSTPCNETRRPFKKSHSKNSLKTKTKRNNLKGTIDSIEDDTFDIALNSGYSPANSKRNTDFHNLFLSVPEEDPLLNDYGCALQREILLQGRIYVSSRHVCFYANIFGWVTILVIAFADIVSIEKKFTAFVIPNAIQISTLNARHFFTSFLARDSAYELLFAMWKQNHPTLPLKSLTESDYTPGKSTEASDVSSESTGTSDEASETSEPTLHPISPRTQPRHSLNLKRRRVSTQCSCLKNGQHYDNVSLDTTFTGTVEKLYNLIMTSGFVKRFIVEVEKCTEVEIGEWETKDGKLRRSSSFIKPLNFSIGPKSTKCYIEDECLHKSFDNYVTTLSTTTTPDVPSGASFSVKTRICIMRAGFNETRIITTCAVDWSKSSWLKGTIEKASIEGQKQYWKGLSQEIRKYIVAHPSEFQDESGSPVLERVETDEVEKDWVKRTQTRSKERTRSIQIPCENNVLEQAEPTPTQRQIAGVWGTLIEVQSIISSILSTIFQNISIPSTNTMIMSAILITMIANFYNWYLLQGIGRRLDSIGGNNVPAFGRGRKNEFLYETRQQDFASILDDRIENEDVLWQWLTDKSKIYEQDYQKYDQVENYSPSSSDDHHESMPMKSQKLHENIGDLHKLLLAAEGHVKKLVDIVEIENAYQDREEKMRKL